MTFAERRSFPSLACWQGGAARGHGGVRVVRLHPLPPARARPRQPGEGSGGHGNRLPRLPRRLPPGRAGPEEAAGGVHGAAATGTGGVWGGRRLLSGHGVHSRQSAGPATR